MKISVLLPITCRSTPKNVVNDDRVMRPLSISYCLLRSIFTSLCICHAVAAKLQSFPLTRTMAAEIYRRVPQPAKGIFLEVS